MRAACKDRLVASPSERVRGQSFVSLKYDVGWTWFLAVLALHALLLVRVPDEDLFEVRVRSKHLAIGFPALEAVDLSWVHDDLAHLQFATLGLLEGCLALRTGIGLVCNQSIALISVLQVVAHLSQLDLSDGNDGRGSSKPLVVVVLVEEGLLVRPRSEVNLLAGARVV